MRYVKIAASTVEKEQLSRMLHDLRQHTKVIRRIDPLQVPQRGYNYLVVLDYKQNPHFAKWVEEAERLAGIDAVQELTEEEHTSVLNAGTRIPVTDILLTMRVRIKLPVNMVEVAALQLRLLKVLSVYAIDGDYQLEVTIQVSKPYELVDMKREIAKIVGKAEMESYLLEHKY